MLIYIFFFVLLLPMTVQKRLHEKALISDILIVDQESARFIRIIFSELEHNFYNTFFFLAQTSIR